MDASFPADVNGVLGVGAVDKNDDRWYYTPSAGNDIDVVAPSGDVDLMGDVRTTDRMGNLGYELSSGDNYTPRFGGTSAAAPQVAGVAALMLSVGEGLSESKVRSKIEAAADDYGNTNWDGQGRLNAFKAVDDAVPDLSVYINGPTFLDSREEGTWYAKVSGGVGDRSYTWEVSPTYSSGWFSASCTGSSCSHSFTNTCTRTKTAGIRVTVSTKEQTETASETVYVDGEGSLYATGTASGDVEPSATPCSSTNSLGSGRSSPSNKAVGGRRLAVRGLRGEVQADRTVLLSWQSEGPVRAPEITVQHRADSAGAWTDLGPVRAADSIGTGAEEARAHRYRTEQFGPGTHQFRLAVTPEGKAGSRQTTGPVTARIELQEAYRLRSYPNPVRERATVELAVQEAQDVTVAVYDVLGRRVTTLHRGRLPAQETKQLSLKPSEAGLTSGTYFVRVQGENFVTTERLTVVQ